MFCRRASRARPTGLYARAIHGAGRVLIWLRWIVTSSNLENFRKSEFIEERREYKINRKRKPLVRKIRRVEYDE